MSDLGKAYIQIIPSAKGISGSISKELGNESQSAGQAAGINIAGAIKTAIAAAGIGTALKTALEAGGNLQQSFGGLETLYGEAAEGAKNYAAEAAKAGISANDYAEQAVSFGASLKQAFGGDTTKAVEAANTAILDMADNSAKMGTDIGAIQNAYQGFAKQNYTMLDNLKLGYGGTKTEMERLLADAQKLTGVKYDISNLGDVYAAIHAVQENLGLTGVAAAEASNTFTGSLGAMKAAGENLLANLALGEDIKPALEALGGTVEAFLFNNLIPMVTNILESLPELISGLSDMLIRGLDIVTNNAGDIVNIGLNIIMSLVNALIAAAPNLIQAAVSLAMALGEALFNADWIGIGTSLINALKDSVSSASQMILGTDGSIIEGVLGGITANLESVLSAGVEIISNLANGILSNIPQLITTAMQLSLQFVSFLLQNAPTILQAGATLLLNLVNGIISNLPQIIDSAAKAIASFTASIASNLPQILAQGIIIIGKLGAGLIQAIPTLVGLIPQIIQSIVNAFGQYDWGSIGINILKGIAEGIKQGIDIVIDAAKGAAEAAFNAAKEFLGIESPSRVFRSEVGAQIAAGMALGITDNKGLVDDAIADLSKSATASLTTSGSYEFSGGQTADDKMDILLSMLGMYLPEIAEKQGIDVQQLYNGFNRQLGWALQ